MQPADLAFRLVHLTDCICSQWSITSLGLISDLYTSIKGTISGFFDITLKPYELIAIKEIPERMVQFYFKMMFNCV